ncbi:MAG: Bifunctional adenosylcobalamin biosynthesis protein CobU [Pelotomaculum sp. PtaU1.Bin035]|nr:MAG: Bifunctional adenosylcobalamin biosynthesis protein CobU [Pelotomaculum sp. PtaU1.Bin035]
MEPGSLIVITGGARSGKSSFAELLAEKTSKKVVYVATARVEDREMAARVDIHRSRRPPDWETVEESLDLAVLIASRGAPDTVFLIDCLGVYLNNLLMDLCPHPENEAGLFLQPDREQAIREEIAKLSVTVRESPADVLIVTNEIGSGLVPPYPLGRIYRDLLGWANQQFASLADEVYLVVAGIPVEIKTLAKHMAGRG